MARIAELEEFAPVAGVDDLGKADQDFLQLLLDGAELFAERRAGCLFSPDPPLDENGADINPPVTKLFSGRLSGATPKRRLRVPGVRVITSITLDGVALVQFTNYDYDPYTEPARTIDLISLTGTASTSPMQIAVTGRWGFNPSPADVKSAILRMAARAYKQRDANFADTITTAEGAAFFFSLNQPAEMVEAILSYKTPLLGLV